MTGEPPASSNGKSDRRPDNIPPRVYAFLEHLARQTAEQLYVEAYDGDENELYARFHVTKAASIIDRRFKQFVREYPEILENQENPDGDSRHED